MLRELQTPSKGTREAKGHKAASRPQHARALSRRAGVGDRCVPGEPSQHRAPGPRDPPEANPREAEAPATACHCPQGHGCLPLRDAPGPRDAVAGPAPSHASASGRALVRLGSAHRSTARGKTPLRAPDEPGLDDPDTLPFRGPRRQAGRRRAPADDAKLGRSLNLHLKFGRASSRKVTLKHSRVEKGGAESCATVPVPN